MLRELPTRWSTGHRTRRRDVVPLLRRTPFPETVTAGIGLDRLGTSSVVYRLTVFGAGSDAPAAVGRFVHVHVHVHVYVYVDVDRESRHPVSVPAEIGAALSSL